MSISYLYHFLIYNRISIYFCDRKVKQNRYAIMKNLFNNKIFSNERMQPWQGEWGDNQQTMNVFVEFVDIPFHSELFNDLFIIHNEKPDRPITYEILDEYGDVLIAGNVSKENSVQITLSVSDLPDNGIYTIVLTSPNPNDRVWSQFEK